MTTSTSLSSQISEAFSALGLILVFVTALFAIRYPQIIDLIQEHTPPGENAQKRQRQAIARCLASACVPLLLLTGLSTYLLSPLFFRVITSSKLVIWGFDFGRTALSLIFLSIAAFFIWSLWLSAMLILRLIRSRTRSSPDS